jgi:dipeptidyl aminopeptidase/acylaminoacyl peptidase
MVDPSELHGTWRLLSWELETLDNGERRRMFGDNPPGFITFAPDGRMFAILTAAGRKPVETEADEIAAFGSLIAYTGLYRIEENRVITRVDVSADPGTVGTELVRYFEIHGDRLDIWTAPFTSKKPSVGLGNRPLRSFLSWLRVSKNEG